MSIIVLCRDYYETVNKSKKAQYEKDGFEVFLSREEKFFL
jgi:hypothetical protein